MRTIKSKTDEGLGEPLSTETDSGFHCEGLVCTCPHCGRPASECDGSTCEDVLDMRELMLTTGG
jgi:hypothetical protein